MSKARTDKWCYFCGKEFKHGEQVVIVADAKLADYASARCTHKLIENKMRVNFLGNSGDIKAVHKDCSIRLLSYVKRRCHRRFKEKKKEVPNA
jgi:hypothetical protein